MRSRHARVTSTDDTCRSRMSAASRVTGSAQSSVIEASLALRGLDREDLVETPAVALLARERCAEERHDALPCRLWPDHPRAEREDVHVVVLDALVGGVGVMTHGRPNPLDLVRGDARANAGATDQDPAVSLSVADGVAEARGEVRVVVLRVGPVAAEVDGLVTEPRGIETPTHLVLERRAGMVRGEGDAHRAAELWPGSVEDVRPPPESPSAPGSRWAAPG